ncbi:hypothetical protein FHS96_000907 [Sphingomonas zeicaulis]|uniref:hypothetical protein n=1 Tax=Sphingomonas zeicaulis TaxID=1632740 RepID=UPI003D20DEA1
MIYKTLGFGLGIFSIALGVAELFATRRIARTLEVEGHENLIRGFGAREIVAGVGLLAAPANASGVWGRVAGDALDLGTLAAAATTRSRNRAVWGALAFVAGVTLIDIVVARGLDRTTGKTFPVRPSKPAAGGATA